MGLFINCAYTPLIMTPGFPIANMAMTLGVPPFLDNLISPVITSKHGDMTSKHMQTWDIPGWVLPYYRTYHHSPTILATIDVHSPNLTSKQQAPATHPTSARHITQHQPTKPPPWAAWPGPGFGSFKASMAECWWPAMHLPTLCICRCPAWVDTRCGTSILLDQ